MKKHIITSMALAALLCSATVLSACNSGNVSKTDSSAASESSSVQTSDTEAAPETEAATKTEAAPESTTEEEKPAGKLNSFGELPAFSAYLGLMSSPRASMEIEDDGSFTVHWTHLAPQPEIDPDTGEDRSQKTITGKLTNLHLKADYIYECEVESCDTDDYQIGETFTILMTGAPADSLPTDKIYPEVLGQLYDDSKLLAFHLYNESDEALFVASQE